MQQKNVLDLFHVDLNYSSLKEYMNEMVHIINEQGRAIDQLQFQIKKTISQEKVIFNMQLTSIIKNMGENLTLQDPEINGITNSVLNQGEMTGDSLIDSASAFNHKLSYILENQNQIIKKERHNSVQINNLQEAVDQKGDKEWVKEKNDRLEQKLQNRMDDGDRTLSREVRNLSQRIDTQIDQFNVNIRKSEKQTLWKIDECEKIIIQKVNKEYVDSSITMVQEKIEKQVFMLIKVQNNQNSTLNEINTSLIRLQEKTKSIENNIDEISKKAKEDEQIFKNEQIFLCSFQEIYLKKIDFETFTFGNQTKLKDLNSNIQLIEARGDPQEFYRRSQELIKQLQNEIFEFEKKSIQDKVQFFIQKIIQDFATEIDILKKKGSAQAEFKQSLHSHDICQVDSEMKQLVKTLDQLKLKQQDNEKITRQKLGSIEMNVMNQIANKRNEASLSNEIKGIFLMKDDVIQIVDKLYGGYNEKIKDLQRKSDETMYYMREVGKHVNFKIA